MANDAIFISDEQYQAKSLRYIDVRVDKEILYRLYRYLDSIGDTETNVSAVIANWIDKQKIADMQESAK